MRFSESEIVEGVLEHIQLVGGEFHEWRVGTAQDNGIRGQVSGVRPQEAESLLQREAYTTFAAEEVVERLAQDFGLQLDRKTIPHGASSSRPSEVVCIYRPMERRETAGACVARSPSTASWGGNMDGQDDQAKKGS